jgi:hypothetical protein
VFDCRSIDFHSITPTSAPLSIAVPSLVVMVCVPCLIVPAVLLFLQFIYNRIPFVKRGVQYFFPGLALAEAKAKADADEASRKAQEAFWASDKAAKTEADASETTKEAVERADGEGMNQRMGDSGSKKKKAATSASTEEESTKKAR